MEDLGDSVIRASLGTGVAPVSDLAVVPLQEVDGDELDDLKEEGNSEADTFIILKGRWRAHLTVAACRYKR